MIHLVNDRNGELTKGFRTLALRRALGAMTGAVIGIISWIITESLRHSSGRLFVTSFPDIAIALTFLIGPVLVAGVSAYFLARFNPYRGSWSFTIIVTIVAVLFDPSSGFLLGTLGSDKAINPMKLILIIPFYTFMGIFRIGPWSLLAGWLVFFSD